MKNKNTAENAFGSATPIFDSSISIPARFLWMVVRHFEKHRPGEPVKRSELIGILGVGEDTLRNYSSELAEHGYLQAESRRDWASRFTGVHYAALPPMHDANMGPEESHTEPGNSVL